VSRCLRFRMFIPLMTLLPMLLFTFNASAVTPVSVPTVPATIPITISASAVSSTMEPHTMWGGTVMMQPGFSISVYASGLGNPRFMAFRPSDGLLFVTDSGGHIYTVAQGGTPQLFAGDMQLPSSIAFRGDYIYVGETSQISRYHAPNNATMPDGPKEVIIPNLPSSGYHWTRTVAIGPDDKLYVAVGSDCESCEEDDNRRGAISVYDLDGSNGRLYATGMRNPVGIAWQPGTNQMWVTNNENDETGDDYLTSVTDGTFYGWPYCYQQTPNAHYSDATRCASVPSYAQPLGGHSTPLGITFGDKFIAPPAYQQSIYVAEHGGYENGTGYRVARIPMVNGKAGKPVDFAIGWRVSDSNVWGRPVGITVGPDGALYITDDMKGMLYRIAATP